MSKKKVESEKESSLSDKKKLALKKKTTSKSSPSKKSVVKKELSSPSKSAPKKATKEVKSTTTKKTDKQKVLVDTIVDGMQEVKGSNITILDLRKITSRVADFYVICHAESGVQVKAIADSVESTVKKKTGEIPFHTEGHQNAEWILIDYVNVVVHVFQTEIRYFYNLELLWADADITKID